MKNLIALSGFVLALFFTGCASRTVPANSYRTPIGRFDFPKDMKARGIVIQGTIGTNAFVLKIDEIESRNNPDVITSSGTAQAMILEKGINATGSAIGNAMAAYTKSMIGGLPAAPQAAAQAPQGPPAPNP